MDETDDSILNDLRELLEHNVKLAERLTATIGQVNRNTREIMKLNGETEDLEDYKQ